MKKQQIFAEEHDGFIGAYYGGPADSKKAIILMLGDSSEDHMAKCGADWVMQFFSMSGKQMNTAPITSREQRVFCCQRFKPHLSLAICLHRFLFTA